MKLWAHVAPHLAKQSPGDALASLHLARCEAEFIAPTLKEYSREWLAERGFQKVDGQWIQGPPVTNGIVEAVGIASTCRDPVFNRKIVVAMTDALQNGLVKGITEPQMQKELMRKARDRVWFRARRA